MHIVTCQVQSRRIVWLLRLLTSTALVVVISTLTVVGIALWKMGAERALLADEQRRLADASNQLRRLAALSHGEILSVLDGTDTQTDARLGAENLQRFVQSELASHPDASVVTPLTDLSALLLRLTGVSAEAARWRGEHKAINADLREQRTLKKVRAMVVQLRGAVNTAQKQRRIDPCIDLSDQLSEFARLAEMLAGEEEIESLVDLKDHQIKPLLDNMTRTMVAAADNGGIFSPTAIEDLRAVLFGAAAAGDGTQADRATGLYGLRHDALVLRRQREKLKAESALIFEDIDIANASFAQSAQGRAGALAAQMEERLGDGWRRMLVFGGGCSLVFLWLAYLISRGIYGQVKAIDLSRAEAEQGRQITHKLMLEQQAAAAELEVVHKKLLETSRRAGMAEVATGVLHNVGNVLNSVNVSSSVVAENLRKSRLNHLGKLAGLLRDHEADLGAYITTDPAGKQIPAFLSQLAEYLAGEQSACLKEMAQLQKNIEHIKDIVTMQQAYAGTSGFKEPVDLCELMEDALRIQVAAMSRHDIAVTREFSQVPRLSADKHKILQIFVNLVSNAKHAMKQSPTKILTVRIESADGCVRVTVRDTGHGIAPENLTRIFSHGFTTRQDGHGFGLHSGALAARDLGGSLLAHSDGPGLGAVFTLDLPMVNQPAAV